MSINAFLVIEPQTRDSGLARSASLTEAYQTVYGPNQWMAG